jgi:hypothetical protein
MKELFDLSDTGKLAAQSFAWDFAIGDRLWQKMGHNAYDCVAHLDCIYSSYGDVLTSESDRLNMLRTGEAVLVHQVKSSATV